MFEAKSTKFNVIAPEKNDQLNEEIPPDNELSKRVIGSAMFEESMKTLEAMINQGKFGKK